MRLHALLILPLFVLHARAASIPEQIVPELEKKLSEAVKEVLDKDAISLKDDLADQELLDQVNAVENIPVAVVLPSEPSVKTEDSVTEETEIKRVAIDLKNPGLPQVQLHDAQNPEAFNDARLKEAAFSQSIAKTQNVLHKDLLNINDKAQATSLNEDNISLVKNSINELQENFSKQFHILNDAVKEYWKPEGIQPLRTAVEEENSSAAESDLRKIENEFNIGVENLSESVDKLPQLKADGEVATATAAPTVTTGAPSNPLQNFVQYVQNFQNSIQSSLNAFGNNLSQYIKPPGNINNPNPSQQPANTSLFSNFIQGVQTSFNNVFRPGTQPSQPVTAAPQKVSELGSNAVPNKNEKPAAEQASTEAPTSPTVLVSQGPIRKILLQIPVVQGIAGAVKKIQGSVTKVESAKDTDEPAVKGHGGYGGPGSEYSDNGNIIRLINNEAMKNEDKQDVADIVDEKKTEEVSNDNIMQDQKLEEKTTEQTLLEVITSRAENPQIEDEANSVTEIEPIVVDRISEDEMSKLNEVKTEEPLKEESSTVAADLMVEEELKIENVVPTEQPLQEEKMETTMRPENGIELELSTEETLTTEGIKEMFIKDDLLVENALIKETVDPEPKGTEVPELEDVTKQEESLKVEESITLNPLKGIENRNQEEITTEKENVVTTTEIARKDEVNPTEEPMNVTIREELKVEKDNKKGQNKKEKRKEKDADSRDKKRNLKLIRRLIPTL